MSTVYLGNDAHTSQCTMVALNEEGEQIRFFDQVRTCKQQLVEAVQTLDGEVQMMLESSPVATYLRRILKPHLERVVVCEPKQNSWISKPVNIDDESAAYKLAELLRVGRYKEVYCTDDRTMDLFRKSLLRYLRYRKKMVTLKQQIHADLAEFGLHQGETVSLRTEQDRQAIPDRARDSRVHRMLADDIQALERRVKEKEKAFDLMLELSTHFDIVDRIEKIPGAGDYCKCVIVARIQNPFRFEYRQQAWRFSQLGVVNRDSNGKKLSKKRLDPTGHGVIKDALRHIFDGARRCKQENAISRFYRACLAAEGDRDHARLSTMRKILDSILSMWKNDTSFDPDRFRHPNEKQLLNGGNRTLEVIKNGS